MSSFDSRKLVCLHLAKCQFIFIEHLFSSERKYLSEQRARSDTNDQEGSGALQGTSNPEAALAQQVLENQNDNADFEYSQSITTPITVPSFSSPAVKDNDSKTKKLSKSANCGNSKLPAHWWYLGPPKT